MIYWIFFHYINTFEMFIYVLGFMCLFCFRGLKYSSGLMAYAIALPWRVWISSLVKINLASFVIPRWLFACFYIHIYSKLQFFFYFKYVIILYSTKDAIDCKPLITKNNNKTEELKKNFFIFNWRHIKPFLRFGLQRRRSDSRLLHKTIKPHKTTFGEPSGAPVI